MSWQQWLIVLYFVANAVAATAMIGKVRQPMAPTQAAIAIVIYAGLVLVAVTA